VYTLKNFPINGEGAVVVNNLFKDDAVFSGTDGVDGSVSFTFSKDQPGQNATISVFAHCLKASDAFNKHIEGCESTIKKIEDSIESTSSVFAEYEASQSEALDMINQELSDIDEKLADAKQKLAESEESYDGANNETAITDAFNDVIQNTENVYSINADKVQLQANKKATESHLDEKSSDFAKYIAGSNERKSEIEDDQKGTSEKLEALTLWTNGDDEGAA